jgi:hypothetical protein
MMEFNLEVPIDKVSGVEHIPGWCPGEVQEYLKEQVAAAYDRTGDGVRVLDLGSWKGRSAITMASALRDDVDLFIWCVDTWVGSPSERETNHKQAAQKGPLSVYWEFLQYAHHFGYLGTRIAPLTLSSKQARLYFTGKYFDLIFLDADHEDVYSDLEGWIGYLKVGGVLVGDDYSWPKVGVDVASFRDLYSGVYNLEFSVPIKRKLFQFVRGK